VSCVVLRVLLLAMSNNDPRNASLELPMKAPPNWTQTQETVASSAMFLASAVMLTRNRYLAWACLLLALYGHFNRQPMRTKDGGSTLGAVLFAIVALIASYLASMVVPPDPEIPLTTKLTL